MSSELKKTRSGLKQFSGNELPWFLFNLLTICQEIAPCDGHIIFSSFFNPRPKKKNDLPQKKKNNTYCIYPPAENDLE